MLPLTVALFPLLPLILASPTPVPNANANAIAVPAPIITPSPADKFPTRTYKDRRDILSSVDGFVNSLLTEIGSNLPTWVASGIDNYLQSFPSGSAVASSLGLSSSDLAALPTSVLNLGPYANWTNNGWNVRLHGNVYKKPNISQSQLNDLANNFLIGTSIQQLPASQADQARNVTANIYVVQQPDVQPTFNLEPVPTAGTAIVQQVIFPYNTTAEGDYDAFVNISMDGLIAGNATNAIQTMQVHTLGTDSGNATAYLVPPTGITIVNDIDDILRVTKIYEPATGLLNTFAKPFTPWMNMPSIYANWSKSIDNLHFHYLTTTPEQITPFYEQFIFADYPLGSFDTRPLNFSDVAATLSIRKFLLQKIFETFPKRKFILVADTSNSDVMKDYPALAHDTNQVLCIFLRNTSATDSGDKFPYDTSGFKGLNQSQYMFFVTPDDLTGLNVVGGECWNKSVVQNVTFGIQGLPFSTGAGIRLTPSKEIWTFVAAVLMSVTWAML